MESIALRGREELSEIMERKKGHIEEMRTVNKVFIKEMLFGVRWWMSLNAMIRSLKMVQY